MPLRAETQPRPAVQVPLRELGFPGYAVSLFHAGASMATLHMLDSTHILFTYSMRSLVPRLPGDNAGDTDRQVAAVIVELPTGKILARTKWHLHDHARYLWAVRPGVFVVRSGNDLSMMAPMQALAAGDDPFRRTALPHRPGQPVAVAGSPDGTMVIVQLESELPPAAGDPDDDAAPHKRKHYTVEFFRLETSAAGPNTLGIQGAGAVGAPYPLRLALDGDGYLWAEDATRGKWTVSFNEFAGRQEKLAPLMSSCRPRLSLLSRSEFLAETCRGSEEEPMLASYGFDGHENWEEPFGQVLQPLTLAAAPQAGRFAISRLVASSTETSPNSLNNGDPINQEIRVYQTESGDLLLHLLCTPAVRSAENFDLSPDGRMLAVLAPETLDLYRLPELSARDRKDLAEAEAMAPAPGSGPVVLQRIARPIGTPTVTAASTPATAVPARADAPASPATPPAMAASPAIAASPGGAAAPPAAAPAPADPTPEDAARRKPPSLLKPGENPEFKTPPAGPQ